MNCPHCNAPIPPDAIVKAAASINGRKNKGKGSRPGARGLVRCLIPLCWPVYAIWQLCEG